MTTRCREMAPGLRWQRLMLVICTLFWLPPTLTQAAEEVPATQVVLWNRNYDTAPVNEVLDLALDETKDLFGPYTLDKSSPLEQKAAFEDLAGKRQPRILDVASGATTPWREEHLLAIRIPVMKGLLGYRVCLTRKAEVGQFSALQTTFDWQNQHLKICQAKGWPDTRILRRNGFTVETTETYGALFSAVSKGDCDCFLRSVGEVGPEAAAHPDLAIEPSILFLYPEPAYFFVRQDNPKLAARIELGLLRAIDDGRYEKLFRTRFSHRLGPLKLGSRILFHLNNPDLSPKSRALLRDDSLWYKP